MGLKLLLLNARPVKSKISIIYDLVIDEQADRMYDRDLDGRHRGCMSLCSVLARFVGPAAVEI